MAYNGQRGGVYLAAKSLKISKQFPFCLLTNVAPGSEKLKEAERLFENLTNKKEYGGDIVDLARALTNGKISAEELVYLCKLHTAKCALRHERDIQPSVSRPKRETKMGMRLSASVSCRGLRRKEEKTHQNAAVRAFSAAVLEYSAFLARTSQSSKYNGHKAPLVLNGWKDVTKMKDDDVFWRDVVRQTLSGKEWGKNEDCQNVTALLERDRCREEWALLPSRAQSKIGRKKWQNGRHGVRSTIKLLWRRNDLDRVVPENGSANILDVLKGMVYLLKGLGRASSAGAVMGWGWPVYSLDTYMVSGKFRQDQGLQCQYQDLHHRALAVHHELHYEATLPTSPDSYVERDDVS
ncbi:hypothetical protein I310_04697 [Cryptococcus deuterogattii CA1014]|nr:hypothetical protein I310_04697 [Cryptococcus deuterogattii CA1014]